MAQTSVPTITPFFGNFRVGRVFSTTGAVFSRNYLIFLLVMAIATVPDLALFGAAPAMPEMRAWAIATILVAWLLGWILTTVGQAVIAYGAFQDMRGAPAPLGEAVKKGLTRFLPIVGLAIVTLLAFVGLALLLLIPLLGFIGFCALGLMLYVMWYVTLPACVVERLGPIKSMKRSAYLTKYHRWRIFGMLCLLIVAFAVAFLLWIGITLAVGGMVGTVAQALWLMFLVLIKTFNALIVAVTYYELRVAKEGVDIDQITAVFE